MLENIGRGFFFYQMGPSMNFSEGLLQPVLLTAILNYQAQIPAISLKDIVQTFKEIHRHASMLLYYPHE